MWLPFHFRWGVPEDGYEWVQVPHKPSGELHLQPVSEGGRRRIYEPLEKHAVLFLEFAEVDATKSGVLAFANEHGNLSASRTTTRWEIGMDAPVSEFVGHTLNDWKKELQEMKDAVEVWMLAKAKNRDGLADLISWKDDAVVYTNRRGRSLRSTLIASPNFRSELLEMWSAGELFGPAHGFLQKIINDHLVDAVSPKLLWDDGVLSIAFQPNNLSAAIWLQFAETVTAKGDREIRRCEHCDRPFVVSQGRSRRTRKYCGDNCRVMAYRNKKGAKK